MFSVDKQGAISMTSPDGKVNESVTGTNPDKMDVT